MKPGRPLQLFSIDRAGDADRLSRYLSSLTLTIRGFGHQHDDPTAECEPRVIGDFEFILYRSGVGRIGVGERSYVCRAGDLVLIPPYVPHEIRTDPSDVHDNYWLHIDVWPLHEVTAFCRLLLPADGSHAVHLPPDSDIPRIMELVAEQFATHRPGSAAAAHGLVRALVASVARLVSVDDADVPRPIGDRDAAALARAIDCVLGNPDRHTDADELAHHAGCSRSRLFSLFRDRLGHPPMEFVRWVRLRQVELRLKTSDLTLEEISRRSGFASPFHLSRAFKLRYGVSPAAYRAAARSIGSR